MIEKKAEDSVSAYCNGSSDVSVCTFHGTENAVSLKIKAADAQYSGLTYGGVSFEGLAEMNAAMHTNLSAADVKYYFIDEDGKGNLMPGVPVEAGAYKAVLEIFDTSISAPFEIVDTGSLPIQPECRTIMSNGAIIGWEPVTGSNIVGYRIDIATDPDFENFVSGYNNKAVNGGSTASITVSGLEPETQYYVRIRMTDTNGGVSENSKIRSFETLSAGAEPQPGTDKEVRGYRDPYVVGDDGQLPVGLLYGEIDYDIDFICEDIFYATNNEGNIVKSSFINLTKETFGTSLAYKYYSINGGRTWTKASKPIDDKKLASLLKKGFTLWLAESYDAKLGKATGEVHKFAKIMKRPKISNFKANYSFYADPSGLTNGMWTLMNKEVELAMHYYLIGVADAKGKAIGEKGYGLWPYEDAVWVAPLAEDGKQVKTKYFVKTAPHGNVPASLSKKVTVYGVAKPSKTKVNYSYETIGLNKNCAMYFAGNADLIAAGEEAGRTFINYIEDTRANKKKLFRSTDRLPFGEFNREAASATDFFGTLCNDAKEKPIKIDISKYISSENRNILVSWRQAESTKPASEKQIIILAKAAAAPNEEVTVKSGSVKLSVSKTVKYQVLIGDKWKTTVPKEGKNTVFEIRQKMTVKAGKENDTTYATGDVGYMVVEYGLIRAGKTPDRDKYGYVKTYLFATQAEAEAKLAELNSPTVE